MKTWNKAALGLAAGIVTSQFFRSREANISYQAQFVEDTLNVVSEFLPGQNSNYDRLYKLAYDRNLVPPELSWPIRHLGFDYYDGFTDTFVVEHSEKEGTSPSSVDEQERIVFYLSGGGYWLQPTFFHYNMARRLANEVSGKVIMPLFPKGPTHNAVDAHKMILARYLYLIEEKAINPKQITIVGDSTGGALAVAFMQQLRDYDLPLPESAILIAPLLDGTMQNVFAGTEQIEYEPFLQPKLLELETVTFAKPFAAIDPLVSPWFGSFENLPPMQVVVGTRDLTLSYMEVLKKRAEAEGLPILFDVYEHMAHIFPIYPIPESDLAIASMGNFIEKVHLEA